MGDYCGVSNDLPLIENIGEFVTFIQRENPGLDQMCQFATLRTFSFMESFAMFGASLGADGAITPAGYFGFSDEVMESWGKSSISEGIPTADALKTNNIIWVADKDSWLRDYPHLAQYKNDYTTNTFIAWPVSVRGAYMTVLGLCARKEFAPSPNLVSFFETIGGLIALQLSKENGASQTQSDNVVATQYALFTRRQREIMRLVADGLTNIQIGNELGFSESTIRQETMRIYELLGAKGRSDAVRMFRTLGI
jgi:DNA-binding CsgD family transcriptional regulator